MAWEIISNEIVVEYNELFELKEFKEMYWCDIFVTQENDMKTPPLNSINNADKYLINPNFLETDNLFKVRLPINDYLKLKEHPNNQIGLYYSLYYRINQEYIDAFFDKLKLNGEIDRTKNIRLIDNTIEKCEELYGLEFKDWNDKYITRTEQISKIGEDDFLDKIYIKSQEHLNKEISELLDKLTENNKGNTNQNQVFDLDDDEDLFGENIEFTPDKIKDIEKGIKFIINNIKPIKDNEHKILNEYNIIIDVLNGEYDTSTKEYQMLRTLSDRVYDGILYQTHKLNKNNYEEVEYIKNELSLSICSNDVDGFKNLIDTYVKNQLFTTGGDEIDPTKVSGVNINNIRKYIVSKEEK